MSEIGRKMFSGAGVGAGVGAVAGGIYGGIQAQQKIEQLPVNQVELPAYDRPMYEDRVVGRDSYTRIDFDNTYMNGHSSHDVTARFPLMNPDGSVRMEHIPAQTIQGHGRPIVNSLQHPIQEPTNVTTHTNIDNYSGVGINQHTNVSYRTIGYWQEPQVDFETGVSRFGHIAGYAAAGAALGAVGGALVAAALQKASE